MRALERATWENSFAAKDFFPRPPFSGSGKIIATAIAFCPLVMWRRWMLADRTNAVGHHATAAGPGPGGGVRELIICSMTHLPP